MNDKVLIVDDDVALLRTLSASLKAKGFEVVSAHTGELGVYLAKHDNPDIALVDLGLPRMDGLDVVSEIRANSNIKIVVLSSRDQEATKVEALNRGADDYVTKPFGIDELTARMRAALRRGGFATDTRVVETPDFTIDLAGRVVVRDGESIHLTATEWRVLKVLIDHEGQVVSHDDLLGEVWGNDFEAPVEYARVYVAAIRKKLEADPAHPRYVITEPSLGYRFDR